MRGSDPPSGARVIDDDSPEPRVERASPRKLARSRTAVTNASWTTSHALSLSPHDRGCDATQPHGFAIPTSTCRFSDAPDGRDSLLPASGERQVLTRNRRVDDQAPGVPDESLARTRNQRSAVGSVEVEYWDGVTVWLTVVVENDDDVLTWIV
jgi:hypothetical protein